MAFQQGTDRGGFKTALMAAFQSAHKKARGGSHPTQVPHDQMTPFNPDKRAPGLMPGGQQAFKMPSSNQGENVLDGPRHPSPAMTAKGPVNHNNDPRRTGLMTAGHQAHKIQMPANQNVATNGNGLEPMGDHKKKIKLPQGQNVDARGLRGR